MFARTLRPAVAALVLTLGLVGCGGGGGGGGGSAPVIPAVGGVYAVTATIVDDPCFGLPAGTMASAEMVEVRQDGAQLQLIADDGSTIATGTIDANARAQLQGTSGDSASVVLQFSGDAFSGTSDETNSGCTTRIAIDGVLNGTVDPGIVMLEADFATSVTFGEAPLSVQFTDMSAGAPIEWFWSFGDGEFSAEQNPSHVYAQDGLYDVSLTVANVDGELNTITRSALIDVSAGAPSGPTCAQGEVFLGLASITGTNGFEEDTFTLGCGATGGRDAAYLFVAPASATYDFNTYGSDYDTVLGILADDCSTVLACNDDSGSLRSRVTIDLTAGQQVVVVIDGFSSGSSGAYVLNIHQRHDAVENNVSFGSAAATGSNDGLANDFDLSCVPDGADAEFAFLVPFSGTYTIDTVGSNFDTALGVYSADGSVQIACNDDGGPGTLSSLTLDLTVGDVITIVVDGYAGSTGDYVLNLDN